jgi:competence protein ComEA
MSKVSVYVRTPLKIDGERIPPSDKPIELPLDEAAPLIAVGAVEARDLQTGDEGGSSGQGLSTPPTLININTATANELAAVQGLGEELAAAVVAHRDSNGPFESVDGLEAISGIGKATVKKLAKRLTV